MPADVTDSRGDQLARVGVWPTQSSSRLSMRRPVRTRHTTRVLYVVGGVGCDDVQRATDERSPRDSAAPKQRQN